jgi:hypothetical protein
MFRVEFALAVDVVNEEPGLADEVIVVFVESLRWLGQHSIDCEHHSDNKQRDTS